VAYDRVKPTFVGEAAQVFEYVCMFDTAFTFVGMAATMYSSYNVNMSPVRVQ
jgi:hypothetical protein